MAVIAAPAAAQDYPTKAVKMLSGFPPGGAVEIVGRVIGEHLQRALGQPFVLEAKPGASGNVAGQLLATAPPDGYTISLMAPTVITVNAVMFKDMPFDPETAFAPISLLVRLPFLVEVSTKHPFKTFAEFAAFAKASPKPLYHGSPGIGSSPHLAAALLTERIGFKSEHVPYRGTGPFSQGMMQKELDWSFDVPFTALSLSKAGHVNLVAITAETRDDRFPGVPTLAELGVPDSVWVSWFALAAPAGTPKPIIDRLSREVANAYKDPEVRQRILNAGLEPYATTPEETARIFAADRARWSKVVKDNNIKAE